MLAVLRDDLDCDKEPLCSTDLVLLVFLLLLMMEREDQAWK